ncbi:MAG TPA: flagellar biosynthesis protein FlgN [Aliiroseovarius sp.]|nr:flagellar biosynthesis protein FlgN [Aliiroseovarius sp.]
MAMFSKFTIIDALDDLLDRERQAILTGNIDGLARQAVEKTRLLEQLSGATTDTQRIERLRVKADRNQELLVAVAKGIKSVSRRLQAMKSAKSTLQTYDKGGHRVALEAKKPSHEKRA